MRLASLRRPCSAFEPANRTLKSIRSFARTCRCERGDMEKTTPFLRAWVPVANSSTTDHARVFKAFFSVASMTVFSE